MFSLKLTRLLWTPVNRDSGYLLCPESQTLMGYLHSAYFHCRIPVLNVELYPVKMLTDFYELIRFCYLKIVPK